MAEPVPETGEGTGPTLAAAEPGRAASRMETDLPGGSAGKLGVVFEKGTFTVDRVVSGSWADEFTAIQPGCKLRSVGAEPVVGLGKREVKDKVRTMAKACTQDQPFVKLVWTTQEASEEDQVHCLGRMSSHAVISEAVPPPSAHTAAALCVAFDSEPEPGPGGAASNSVTLLKRAGEPAFVQPSSGGLFQDLSAKSVTELQALAVEQGIKKEGVDWPSCCPPDGGKAAIISGLMFAASSAAAQVKAVAKAADELKRGMIEGRDPLRSELARLRSAPSGQELARTKTAEQKKLARESSQTKAKEIIVHMEQQLRSVAETEVDETARAELKRSASRIHADAVLLARQESLVATVEQAKHEVREVDEQLQRQFEDMQEMRTYASEPERQDELAMLRKQISSQMELRRGDGAATKHELSEAVSPEPGQQLEPKHREQEPEKDRLTMDPRTSGTMTTPEKDRLTIDPRTGGTMTTPSPRTRLPWDNDVQPLVIDNGSHTVVAGFGGDDAPAAIFATVVGYVDGTKVWHMLEPGTGVYVGDMVLRMRSLRPALQEKWPIHRGVVEDWDAMEKIWLHTFRSELRVNPRLQPVLLTEPPLNPKANRERTIIMWFENENFEVPGLCFRTAAHLSLIASGRTTGTVVYGEIFQEKNRDGPRSDGHGGVIHSVPIIDGCVIEHAVSTQIVAQQFAAAPMTCDAAVVHESIMKCDSDFHEDLFNRIVLAGKDNLHTDDLLRQLKALAPTINWVSACTDLRAQRFTQYSAWLGGSILAALDGLDALDFWVTKEEYNGTGPDVVHRKCW